ncbi:MAG TPA: DUF4340 domain-containing protein [Polyangiaceae bacterium]|jgi:hypothetical protein|nr:MAG: hypothetical protein BWY17_01196 [Deltaproteobacteria bacterium ADurb.Bin207]HNS96944.1 DUF4340 domain-containing protein [Polyangiaceae bacterium]HNZ21269.1 DUF4340 domain-containing protein [Polyangiaceae bacterium]HOD21045.1 DUF4340 domain-containing protein [Polyangiaceae bacterium]HOE48657.1 DUF4340 domain-containing protein [Polyangiaceae bacterium]
MREPAPSFFAKMRSHATSLLLVVIATALGLYVWIDRDQPSTTQIEARKGNLLPIFRQDDLREIVIEQGPHKITLARRETADAGEATYDLIEQDGKPQDAVTADQFAVDKLVHALQDASPLRHVEGQDLKSLGLDPPLHMLTVNLGSVVYRIGIGDEAKSPKNARFVSLEGQGAYVLSPASAQDFMRPIDSYRTRRIVPVGVTELAAIEVAGSQGTLRLARGSWGGFRVESEPAKPRASSLRLDRIYRAFADLNAEHFVDPKLASRIVDGAERKIRLSLTPKSGPRVELVLAGACPIHNDTSVDASTDNPPSAAKLVVAIRTAPTPVHACVPSSVFDDLDLAPASVVDRRVFRGTADEVEELRIVQGDRELELARAGTGWHERKPQDSELADEDVAGYLAALLTVEGTIAIEADEKKLGLSPPHATIRLQHPSLDSLDIPPQQVEIGGRVTTQEGASIAVRRREDGAILLVPASTAPLFEPSTAHMRSTALLQVGAQQMQRVEVRFGQGQRQILRRRGPGFEMLEPKGYAVDAALAADLFDTVSHLRAERWVAERDDGSFGLGTPSLIARMTFDEQGKEQTRSLRLGTETQQGRYGRWDPDTGVFVLSRATEKALQTYAIDRLVFMVDPSEVHLLRLEAGTKDVWIGVTGDSWRSQRGSMHPMDEATIAKIRQLLSELRAEGVVTLGAAKPEQGFAKPQLRVEVQSVLRKEKIAFSIGYGDVWRSMNVVYVRRDGVEATYAIAQSKVLPLIEAMGGP